MLTATYKPEITLNTGFRPITSKKFQAWVKTTFNYARKGKDPNGLFSHQRLIRDYMQIASPYRGILLFHALGVGKTRSAIAVSEVLVNHKDVIVMLPASLQNNFLEELYRFGNEAYVKKQHWAWNGAKWLHNPSKPPNYSDLNDKDRRSLDVQINDTISRRIRFMRYNGLTKRSMTDILRNDPTLFDNKLVIIDEVHNFISRVVSGSSIAKMIYKLIMQASDIKLVCLSGTPLINYAVEFPVLMNLLVGYVRAHKVACMKKVTKTLEQVSHTLNNDPHVMFWNFDNLKHTLHIKLCPHGFIKTANGFLLKSDTPRVDEDAIVGNILTKAQVPVKAHGVTSSKTTLLPFDEKTFYKTYVNFQARETKEVIVANQRQNLLNAIRGLVSYFNFYNPDDYPIQEAIEIVKVPVTETQWPQYLAAREVERKIEDKEQKFVKSKTTKRMFVDIDVNKSKGEDYNFNYFKVFSRSIGNFAFHRNRTAADKKDPRRLIREARNEACFSTKLMEHGPKYQAIMNRMSHAKGPVVIYSQYRNAEGIAVMKEVLKAQGYSELEVKGGLHVLQKNKGATKRFITFSNEDPIKTRILMDIFNGNYGNLPRTILDDLKSIFPDFMRDGNKRGNVVGAILITQSGSEGISLKNVRQVHILEPYWNYIRLRQIIGRAVRAHSHGALSPASRNVQVFLYMLTIASAQMKKQARLDNGETSDESVYNTAIIKNMRLSALTNLMKEAAFDCEVHKKTHSKHESFPCLNAQA